MGEASRRMSAKDDDEIHQWFHPEGLAFCRVCHLVFLDRTDVYFWGSNRASFFQEVAHRRSRT